MEKKQRNNNNRGRNRNNNSGNRQERQQPQRRRRVSVDRNTEVMVISNAINSEFYYKNPRVSITLDLKRAGDEEYLTVADLRAILNSHRKVLEGFKLIIVDVMDDRYTLEDVLVYLGLEKKYEEFYSLSRKRFGEAGEVSDIKNFVLNAPFNAFEKTMAKISEGLRARVIESAVTLFKLGEFGDYNKMRVIEDYVGEDLFNDSQETEIENDVY